MGQADSDFPPFGADEDDEQAEATQALSQRELNVLVSQIDEAREAKRAAAAAEGGGDRVTNRPDAPTPTPERPDALTPIPESAKATPRPDAPAAPLERDDREDQDDTGGHASSGLIHDHADSGASPGLNHDDLAIPKPAPVPRALGSLPAEPMAPGGSSPASVSPASVSPASVSPASVSPASVSPATFSDLPDAFPSSGTPWLWVAAVLLVGGGLVAFLVLG